MAWALPVWSLGCVYLASPSGQVLLLCILSQFSCPPDSSVASLGYTMRLGRKRVTCSGRPGQAREDSGTNKPGRLVVGESVRLNAWSLVFQVPPAGRRLAAVLGSRKGHWAGGELMGAQQVDVERSSCLGSSFPWQLGRLSQVPVTMGGAAQSSWKRPF